MAKAKPPFGGHKLYGSTTIGSRGQMVVPVKARRDFQIKSGDELLVAGAHGRFLMVMKLSDMKGVIEELSKRVKEFQKLLGKVRKT